MVDNINTIEADAADMSESPEVQEHFREAKRKFEDAIDHNDRFHSEAHRAIRFYSNSELEGQWENDDLAYLRDNGRPAFSFNIVATKVNDFLGFYADAQRAPRISPAGAEDKLLGEVLDISCEQIMQDANAENLLGRVLKTGTVAGECGLHIEVEPHDHGQGWVQVNLYRIMPFELHWDAASIEPDRSDARCVFWDRWLSKDEFGEAYPDSDAYTTGMGGHADGAERHASLWAESGVGDDYWEDDYQDSVRSSLYYDRHKRKIRVIRYEYKTFEDQITATNMATGQSREIGEEELPMFEVAIQRGQPIQISSKRIEVVKVMEFCGVEILAEYERSGPFDGFSIVSYAYAMDEETGTPYGIVRNLFDPQMELNKAKSLEIEHIAQSTATGTTAEKGAIDDEEQYVNASRQPGAVRIVAKDALVEGRVRDNVVTPPNASTLARAQGSVDLFHEISGIPSSADVTPAAQAQAATTVAIRYNKARQSVSQPFAQFESMQKMLLSKVAQTIVRAMPDDQILSLLSAPRFQIQGGVVYEMTQQMTPQGQQMVPSDMAELRRIRDLQYNIELEFTSESSTLRTIEFNTLSQLAQAGVPVDPEVLIERAVASRSAQEQLKQYVQQAQAEAAQTQQQQLQAQQEQFQALAQAEMAKSQVNAQKNAIQAQANQTDAMLEARGQTMDALLEIAKIWEAADENEKARLFEFLRSAQGERRLLQ